MALKQPFDFGQIYNKTGAGGFGTVASSSNILVADRASKVRIEVVVALQGGSTAGNVTVTALSSRDGTNFDAMQITTDATNAAGATGTVTTSAGSTVRASFSIDPSAYKGGVKFTLTTAGASSAADSATITAEAV